MFEKFFPRKYSNWVRSMIFYAGMKTTPAKYIDRTVIVSFVVAVFFAVIIIDLALIIFLAVFVFMVVLMNGLLVLAVERRKNFVEKVLPDALELMAANIKSGFIPSQALLLSARPEFGPLSEVIKRAGNQIMTGLSFSEGLKEIPKMINSEILARTVRLISEGSTQGGQIVNLLEENAVDIRRKQAIKKEVKVNIMMYGIFIVFAGVLGAPVLYALSIHLIGTIASFGGGGAVPESFSGSVPFMSMSITISEDFLLAFSVISIVVTTFFSGLIIGLIDTGKEKGGIKYVPIFMIIALAVFFSARFVIQSMFSGFLPG